MADPLPDDVLAALEADHRIEAIKLLREARQPRTGPRTALGFPADRRTATGLGPGVLASLAAGAIALVLVLISRR